MKKYDLIVVGSGSSMNIVPAMMNNNHELKVAIIDKDEPGGICLTRGCIPSKMILYPAELIRTINHAKKLGIDVSINSINFKFIMDRMRSEIGKDIENIRQGLSNSPRIDYYHDVASFTAPYQMRVGNTDITAPMIFLCTGSEIHIPNIKNLDKVGYLTSDTVLKLDKKPKSLTIIGGGYIAAEFGHFFSAMGVDVTIVGRNRQLVPGTDPEVAALLKHEFSKVMNVYTNYEVNEVKIHNNQKVVVGVNRSAGEIIEIESEEILVATGRSPNSDILRADLGGIETDERGWIKTNEYMETSKENIFAFGDANGKYLYKHLANKESIVVGYRVLYDKKIKMDYSAVPWGVFTYPEIAGVGYNQQKAIELFGEDKIAISLQFYMNTAKGKAMEAKNYFVKVIINKENNKIIGAQIIGPYATILIQEIITMMNSASGTFDPIYKGMHIHPSLSEVVERAFGTWMSPHEYDEFLKQFDALNSNSD